MPAASSKAFIAPVWILGVAAFIRTGLIILTIVSVKMYFSKKGQHIPGSYYVIDCSIVVVAIIQSIIYWKLRKRMYSRKWVLAHVLLMVFILVLLPVLYALALFMLSRGRNAGNYSAIMLVANQVRFYLFWSCLIAATVFFIATVVKSKGSPDETLDAEVDAIGID